jgi:16S rRNA (guanine527-N7)-methyltransferase
MAHPLLDRLLGDLHTLGLAPSTALAERLLAYAELLHRWNQKIRLVGPNDLETIVREQLVDACGFIPAVAALDAPTLVDVGSGGGLPGLVLALANPDRELTMIEPIHKKTAFLTHAAHALSLSNVRVHTGRVDELGRVTPPTRRTAAFSLALSRATLAPSPWLLTGRHLVGQGGLVLIALAGEETLPADVDEDPHTSEVGRWRYTVAATGAPRTLIARSVL